MIENVFNPKAFMLDQWYLNTTKTFGPQLLDDLHRSYDGGKLPPLSVAIKHLDRDWVNKLIAQGAHINKRYFSGNSFIRPLYEIMGMHIESEKEEQKEEEEELGF